MKGQFKICPVCGGELDHVRLQKFMMVMDGNSVYQCTSESAHRFWSHPFENGKSIHLHPNASVTGFKSDADYDWNGTQWILSDKENKNESES